MQPKILIMRACPIIAVAGVLFFVSIVFFPSLVPSLIKTPQRVAIVNSVSKIPMSYHGNIIKDAQENENYRRVVFTGKNSQLVVMSIPPGTDVGKETHKYTEQTLFFLSGTGEGELDGKEFPVAPGDVVVVVPGTEHNFRATGAEALKIYTVYAPPNHIDGRIHPTKADSDADMADEAVGESAPAK